MSVEKNKNGYNEWSSFYDDYPNPTVAIDDLVFPNVYSKEFDKNILEIGCGTGRHTKRLVQARNRVTAIDASWGMLEEARRKIKSSSLTLLQGDFLETEVPNGPFDLVIMSLVLEHIRQLTQFFEKTRGLIKVDGTFYFSEIHPDRTSNGIMAHFKTSNGETHLSSFPHTEEEIVIAATENRFSIERKQTVRGTQELALMNEKWGRYLNVAMIQIWTLTAIV